MNWDGQVRRFRIRARASGFPEVWDAMRGDVTSLPHTREGESVDFYLTLASCESVLLVFAPVDRRLPPRLSASDAPRMRRLVGTRTPVERSAAKAPPLPASAIALESASWIWHAGDGAEPGPCVRWFRCTLELPSLPQSAEISIAADNEYALYVNGRAVGTGAAWERADVWDAAPLLSTGRNVLALRVRNAGDGPNPAGVVAALTLDGTSVAVSTGGEWVSSDAPGAGWESAGFDDSAWHPVRVLGRYGIGPWGRAGAGTTVSPIEAADPYDGVFQVPGAALNEGWRVFLVADGLEPEPAARITVNGVYAGGFVCQPLRLDITRYLRRGANTVRVEPFAPEDVWLACVPPPGRPGARPRQAVPEDGLKALGYAPATVISEGEAR